MTILLKTKNAINKDGKIIQHALYDAGASFQIHRWEETMDANRVVEEIPYEGNVDRRAARAMAMGALSSLHQQALHEIYGNSYVDTHGIALYWAEALGRYVTVPAE